MIDGSFYIGETHQICQDYVLGGFQSIALADGCSGSSLTDYGSRILCSAAIPLIEENGNLMQFDEKMCILTAQTASKILNLPLHCLDATLLLATANKTVSQAVMFGDGVIATKRKDGSITVVDVSFRSVYDGCEYPFYLTYLCDKRAFNRWMNGGITRTISMYSIEPDGEVKSLGETSDPENANVSPFENSTYCMLGEKFRVVVSVPNEEIEWISVMSDGVGSFHKEQNIPIPTSDILKELLSFRNFNPSFAQRRMNKFRKFCDKNGWKNMDDVSVGTIYVGG